MPIPIQTLIADLLESNGKIYLARYGGHIALGFQGPDSFVKRCFNLCMNRGMIRQKAGLFFAWVRGVKTWYVYVSSEERVRKGLAEQFRSEIIMNGEILPLTDFTIEDEEGSISSEITFDEDRIAVMAARRADAFMAEHVIRWNFMDAQDDMWTGNGTATGETVAPIYAFREPVAAGVGGGGDEE